MFFDLQTSEKKNRYFILPKCRPSSNLNGGCTHRLMKMGEWPPSSALVISSQILIDNEWIFCRNVVESYREDSPLIDCQSMHTLSINDDNNNTNYLIVFESAFSVVASYMKLRFMTNKREQLGGRNSSMEFFRFACRWYDCETNCLSDIESMSPLVFTISMRGKNLDNDKEIMNSLEERGIIGLKEGQKHSVSSVQDIVNRYGRNDFAMRRFEFDQDMIRIIQLSLSISEPKRALTQIKRSTNVWRKRKRENRSNLSKRNKKSSNRNYDPEQ